MKLSVIMPVYNEELLLPYSLGSILTIADEVIIVNGNELGPSTDGTKGIIDKLSSEYPGIITHLQSAFALPDGRWDAASQRNLGVKNVTGDFIFLVDADEVIDTDHEQAGEL